MFNWVTKGKEIENYIPVEAICGRFHNSKIRKCGQYELFPEYISKYYNCFSKKKVQFANEIKEMITMDNAKKMLDLEKKVQELYTFISAWNK